MAIIAILAAILLPVFSVARERARRNACTTNLQKIGTALQQYALDQGGYPPDLWTAGATTQPLAWHAGLLLLMGKSSPFVASNPGDALANLPTYIANIEDFHCPDNAAVTNPNQPATTTAEGYDNYDGPDVFGVNSYGAGNTVSAQKYTLSRLPANDFGVPAGSAFDFSNPDYTRQLKFTHPDSDTVVTWCAWHRPAPTGVPTPTATGKDELVLFLDGKVMNKLFQAFSTTGPAIHPVTGNGLRAETDP